MKRADDPKRDYRKLVERGYDAVSATFNESRSHESADALAPLLAALADGARVLDLGCGAGVPITLALAERFDVTGVDISAEQLALGRQQVRDATFIHADMAAVDFADASFDAVVSFYAIFHLPRAEHAPLFARIHRWLRPGGYLLASLAMTDEAAYTEEFFGTEMYWSNFGIDAYRTMVRDAGFTILRDETLGHGYGEGDHAAELHPLVFARRDGGADGEILRVRSG
jgi:cyclopropane fatty-acyl-phospholipid synthase-like methyltransferase